MQRHQSNSKLDASCRKRQLSPHPATPNPAVVPKSDFIPIFVQMIIIVTSKNYSDSLLFLRQNSKKNLIFKFFKGTICWKSLVPNYKDCSYDSRNIWLLGKIQKNISLRKITGILPKSE